ncbi:sulfotransferase [Nonomuraea sp. NPDC052129]|uniref:sulfotransferase n=1 Tax=Nonomuraea sp. NPDC052129 TaxID=3154651 RepID=UPI003418ED80
MTPAAPRVLYVTGWCRSGSTLLGNLLNELPGVAHVGELNYLWSNGVLGTGTNSTCGCGKDLQDCEVWRRVLRELDGHTLATEMIGLHNARLRTRFTQERLREARGMARPPRDVRRISEVKRRLYTAIGAALDAEVIVDTSKFPAEAAHLMGLPDLRPQVLHMVRDPRATAYSWHRAKGYIPAMSPLRSSAYWTGFNAASEWIARAYPGRCLRLRYEDFAARPAETIGQVMAWAGLPPPGPVIDGNAARLGVNHTVTGNPDRLRTGPVAIRPDDAWRTALPASSVALSTLAALPLMSRYGYRLTSP